jgi:hypothetical protein
MPSTETRLIELRRACIHRASIRDGVDPTWNCIQSKQSCTCGDAAEPRIATDGRGIPPLRLNSAFGGQCCFAEAGIGTAEREHRGGTEHTRRAARSSHT